MIDWKSKASLQQNWVYVTISFVIDLPGICDACTKNILIVFLNTFCDKTKIMSYWFSNDDQIFIVKIMVPTTITENLSTLLMRFWHMDTYLAPMTRRVMCQMMWRWNEINNCHKLAFLKKKTGFIFHIMFRIWMKWATFCVLLIWA